MWLILALFSRLCFAACNALDQLLARAHRTHRTEAAMALELFCALPFGLLTLFFADPGKVTSPLWGWAIFAGALQFTALIPYYKCLQRREAVHVVPYLEMTPLFLMILLVIFAGEHLTSWQWAGAGLIVISGFLFSWDFKESRFQLRIFLTMTLCALCFAFSQFGLRLGENEGGFWQLTGLFLIAEGTAGAVLLAGLPSVRRSVRQDLVDSQGRTALIAISSNLASFLGLLMLLKAFLIAPTTAHVAALSSVQPFFSFMLAFVLHRLYPQHFAPASTEREPYAKIALLFSLLIGMLLLLLAPRFFYL